MEKILKDYLFAKHYLVADEEEDGLRDTGETESGLGDTAKSNPLHRSVRETYEHLASAGGTAFDTAFSLANLFGIRIRRGANLLRPSMIPYVAERLGKDVPAPFYRGFPKSVRKLTKEQLLFDQLVHYAMTYGFGFFDAPGYSLFERDFERIAFAEHTEPKDFSVADEAEARSLVRVSAKDLLAGTRPLSDTQFEFLAAAVRENLFSPDKCASKDTAVRLLYALRDPSYARFLDLPDFIRLVDELHYREYEKETPKDFLAASASDQFTDIRLANLFGARRNLDIVPMEEEEDLPKMKPGLRKLNLRNQDRKFLTAVLDLLLEKTPCESNAPAILPKAAILAACFEKKALWSGVLHHLHYRPKTPLAEAFVRQMRGSRNLSSSSRFEALLANGDPVRAAASLGSGAAVLRHLQYLLSRCRTMEEAEAVLDSLDSKNAVVLLQLFYKYAAPADEQAPRTFRFTKHNLLKVHKETEEESARRKSRIAPNLREKVVVRIRQMLEDTLRGRLGRVYLDPAMRRIGVPIQENASSGGFGVLPKGSRLPIPAGKKVRAFTYWEQVDDIDLSVIGLGRNRSGEYSATRQILGGSLPEGAAGEAASAVPENAAGEAASAVPENAAGEAASAVPENAVAGLYGDAVSVGEDFVQMEFSWRSMAGEQSDAITFSGDETAGFNGGSEYFDIDLDKFRELYPWLDVLIFCDNVFSRTYFEDCICRAGYMVRDVEDSGEVFEPKTVASSFTVNCRSTSAFLFAIDLKKREFVWLNTNRSGDAPIAGAEELAYLVDYLHRAEVFNVYDLFAAMATELVDAPEEADLIVSDRAFPENIAAEKIRSCDVEKIIALLEGAGEKTSQIPPR